MGKPKATNSKSKKEPAVPRCVCDHPFTCSCGNRPPRPSKGHKWDPETQQWGGKGHKQKGASGQARVVGEQVQTTAVGQTQIAQWQQLPSGLLKEYCKKQKRPPPKFKQLLEDSTTKFKVRCIVPDPKDSDKDLILVPANAVGNEEQAMEEAALLALLQLTPNLPHERKLPEPYKTTWLTAIEALKGKNKVNNNPPNKASSASAATLSSNVSTTTTTTKAVANTNLALGTSHVSAAERRRQEEQRKQELNARIRRHEAIRMANRNHPVFLSAKFRHQIQRLLQGGGGGDFSAGDDDDDNDDEEENSPELSSFQSDQQQYVEERLHQEGFTKRQARRAFEELASHFGDNDEGKWEQFYDECLQWLCVHLPEHQLPEGFDPRGQTLEIVAPKNATTKTSETQMVVANKFGLSPSDASWLVSQAKQDSVEKILWTKLVELAQVSLSSDHSVIAQQTSSAFQEELEALEAMFPEGLNIKQIGSLTVLSIPTPDEITVEITVETQLYPAVPPQSVLCFGKWPRPNVSVGFHVELVKFISTMTRGEPMIFEIFTQVQTLLQTLDELPPLSLTKTLASTTTTTTTTATTTSALSKTKASAGTPTSQAMRPRERGIFWSTHPSKTPPAMAFPKSGIESQRKELPAGKARSDFLSRLKQAAMGSRVVLVTGDTGCGKTTQIPQFILEEAPTTAKIVVAQPRRLAATGVATRVAEERGESKPGLESVGYTVRGDTAVNKNTRLLFCTFGILLRQLQSEGALDNITHIVLDEVHERNLDGDVLMGLLKQLLPKNPHLHIVLMSATLDADRFAAYWGANTPQMHIPGRTFPVEDYYLEDVLMLTGYNPPKKRRTKYFGADRQQNPKPRKSTPWDDSELSDADDNQEDPEQIDEKQTLQSNEIAPVRNNDVPLEEKLKRINESDIDYEMLGHLIKCLIRNKAMGSGGSILVFLPGAPEINQAKTVIGKMTEQMPVLLLPLHGGLQPREQNLVFRPSPNAVKVILSTNVAETSITIPDCTVVIDGCREKQSSYDPINRMPLLIEVFASQASLQQRRGRAGRVREGKCYKLISRDTHAKLHQHSAPEITRCALDQTLLSLLFLGVENGNGSFLRTLLDPPKTQAVDAAVHSLWKIGALEKSGPESIVLTPLGMHLAGIPAPPMIGKMLVMGAILGCRRAALAMAAGVSTGKSPFLRVDKPRVSPNGEESMQQQKDRVILEERAKLLEQTGNSDHAMLAAAFLNWEMLPAGSERKKYCEKLGLSFNGMRDILQLVNQYDSALSSSGYVASAGADRNAKSWRVLRTCAIAAFAPSQLVRVQRPSTKYASTAEGAREKDGVAKELSFFVRMETSEEKNQSSSKEERVFLHPSSALFPVGGYSCPWLVYNSMVKTSKPFLRDATECSAYALLLFGGNLEVEARNSVIIVDGWVKLAANARIGALIRGLREKMDDLLSQKIKDPRLEIFDTPEMKLIVTLLITDGLWG